MSFRQAQVVCFRRIGGNKEEMLVADKPEGSDAEKSAVRLYVRVFHHAIHIDTRYMWVCIRRQANKKGPTARAGPFKLLDQERFLMRSRIQFCTSSSTHATRPLCAPVRGTLFGKRPSASRRAMWAKDRLMVARTSFLLKKRIACLLFLGGNALPRLMPSAALVCHDFADVGLVQF